MHPNFNTNSNEHELQWITQIRRIFEQDFEDYDDVPISISNVPKPLLKSKPEAYTPQLVALGPYHHFRDDLREMERYKLFSAKRSQIQFPQLDFPRLVDLFAKLELAISSHYHKYLDINGEALAWMMALDASFLLEFLHVYAASEGSILLRVPSRMSHLVDATRRKSAHDVLLRDVVMLENQIPLFLLRKILEIRCSSSKLADEALSKILIGFINDVSPFKNASKTSHCVELLRNSHLLELLYHQLVSAESEEPSQSIEGGDDQEDKPTPNRIIIVINNFIARLIKNLTKIPWMIITTIATFVIKKHPVGHLFTLMDESPKHNTEALSPLLEEIAIPSVTELAYSGIAFSPRNGDLSVIEFDKKRAMFHLPIITLDFNTEVVLRNLVAYETSIVSGPVVFTRYVELMNGIIDTEEDVKLLRQAGVVKNRLKSDAEVAELWNGLSRSVRLSRAPAIDRVIEDVNDYYDSNWRVKIGRIVRRFVVDSRQPFRLLALVLLVFVMSLQAYCVIHGCARS